MDSHIKTNNHKTLIADGTTHRRTPTERLEEEFNLLTGRQQPISEELIEAVGKQFFEWAEKDKEALTVHAFFRKKGLGWSTIRRWRLRSPIFAEYYLNGMNAIGDRRERGAIKRKYEPSMIRQTAHCFNPDYREAHYEELKLKAELANKEANESVTNVIYELCTEEHTHKESDGR